MNSFAAVPKFRYNVLLTLSDSVLQTLGEISKKKKKDLYIPSYLAFDLALEILKNRE